jgi:hypothetical protein
VNAVRVELFQDADSVPLDRRARILDEINRIIAMDWNVQRPHWTAANTPFHTDHGLVLVSSGDELLGELVYRRLAFGGRRVIYISGTDVSAAHRDQGFLRLMLDAALGAEFATSPAADFYLCFRTRSPLVHYVGRTLCDPMVPATDGSGGDPALHEIALRVARSIFPNHAVEESLAMRGIYTHMSYKREPTCRLTPETNRWFAAQVPEPQDAVFCLGVCRNRWASADQ